MRNLISTLSRLFGGASGVRLRIAVVAPRIAKFDGTSNAIRDTIRAVSGIADWRVDIFSKASEVDGIRVHQVESATDLCGRIEFRSADVIIYHFGFYDELFEIIQTGNGKGLQFVFFRNVTPAEYLPEELKPLVERSFLQLQYFHYADRLWPFSKINAEVLIRAGMDAARIRIVNPVVEWPPRRAQIQKASLPIEILFVGRITKSKGVLDLLDAVQDVRSQCRASFHVRLIGNQVEQSYFDAVRNRAAAMAPLVEFIGRCGNDDLERRYHAAHILAIPSYHEGFCRPVAEGLRAGCIPVGYASFNLPLVANGLGRLTEPGNVAALAGALKSMIESVAKAIEDPTKTYLPLDRGPTTLAEFDALAGAHVGQFTFDRFSDTVIGGIRTLAS